MPSCTCGTQARIEALIFILLHRKLILRRSVYVCQPFIALLTS